MSVQTLEQPQAHAPRPRAPRLFRVRTEHDLANIPFVDGMAAVEVDARLLDRINFKNDHRGDSPRLQALERAIRANGYQPVEPITARIGRKGRWVIVNGGHRLTAARNVMGEFWTNLRGPKVRTLYFVLFLNPNSFSRTDLPPGVVLPQSWDDEDRDAWDRAADRMRERRDPV